MTGRPDVIYVGEDRKRFEVSEAVLSQPGATLEWGVWAFDAGVTFTGSIDIVNADAGFLAFLFCDVDDLHDHRPDGTCVPPWIELGDG